MAQHALEEAKYIGDVFDEDPEHIHYINIFKSLLEYSNKLEKLAGNTNESYIRTKKNNTKEV